MSIRVNPQFCKIKILNYFTYQTLGHVPLKYYFLKKVGNRTVIGLTSYQVGTQLLLFTRGRKFSVFKCFWLDTLLNIYSKYLCGQKEWICSSGNFSTQICHPSLNKASKGLFSGSYMQAIGTTKRGMTGLQCHYGPNHSE